MWHCLQNIQEFDYNGDGIISYKEFVSAMEEHVNYTRSVLAKHPKSLKSCHCYSVNLRSTGIAGVLCQIDNIVLCTYQCLSRRIRDEGCSREKCGWVVLFV